MLHRIRVLDFSSFDQSANMSVEFACFFPASKGRSQLSALATHLSHFFVELLQALAYDLAHLTTWTATGLFVGNDLFDFLERETEHLGAFDEIEPREDLGIVKPVSALRPSGPA